MQVTHATDHITHAVIGGQAAQAFGINDSPEFFRILSSSLYSDKKLAVIREIACNAWDAHVEFDQTDRPIEFVLTKDSLVIRDFGPGISPADIIKNYTTYGGTTKIANDNVTGGFGLGSKAPFAYVDHFEVITCHKGKKHIYRMSLSSAEVNGRPSVVKIMDAPCGDETGVTVTLDIEEYDFREFENIIRRIVRNGEMNATLNGQRISTLPFSKAPNNFIILPTNQVNNVGSQILLRYGHVIYPIDRDSKFRQEYDSAIQFLNRISNLKNSWQGHGRWAVVLYAQPGEVSVTPSRETLSMTDQTIATIRDRLANFIGQINLDEIDGHCFKILEEAVTSFYTDGVPGLLCTAEKKMPNPRWFQAKANDLDPVIYDTKDLAWHFMCGGNYPDRHKFWLQDLKIRVQSLMDQQFGDPILNRRFLQELKRLGKPDGRSDFLQRRVFWPIIRDLKKCEESPSQHGPRLRNMMVIEYRSKIRGYGQGYYMTPILGYRAPKIGYSMPFLRKVIILSHNRMQILEDGFKLDALDTYWGKRADMLCYIVPRQPAKVKEAREFFETRGFTVLDITPNQVIEKDPNEPPKVRAAPKPKRKGVPTLRTFINDDKEFDVGHGYYRDDNELIELPKFVTMMSPTRINVRGFLGMPEETLMPIVRLYGDKGACVPSRQAYEKLIAMGVPPLDKWVKAQLAEDMLKSKAIEKYYRNYRPHGGRNSENLRDIFLIARNDESLRRKWKLPPPLSQRDQDLIAIYEAHERFQKERDPSLKLVREAWTKWEPSAAHERLSKMLYGSQLIHLLNLNWVLSTIRNGKPNEKLGAKKLLLTAMKG